MTQEKSYLTPPSLFNGNRTEGTGKLAMKRNIQRGEGQGLLIARTESITWGVGTGDE